MTLAHFLSTMLRDRWIVSGLVFVSAVASLIILLTADPVYRASVTLMPVEDSGEMGALSDLAQSYAPLASLAGINLEGRGNLRVEAIASLNSRSFTADFIRDEDLMPVLFPNSWDGTTHTWKASGDPPTMDDALDLFNRKVRTVTEDSRSGLVTLEINWTDRELAASWANSLVRRLNERMRRRAVAEGEETISYLTTELSKTNILEIKQSIYGLIEAKIRENALANVRSEYAFRVIDPAMVPDSDNFVYPRRVILLALGLGVGITLALIFVYFHAAILASRASTRDANA